MANKNITPVATAAIGGALGGAVLGAATAMAISNPNARKKLGKITKNVRKRGTAVMHQLRSRTDQMREENKVKMGKRGKKLLSKMGK